MWLLILSTCSVCSGKEIIRFLPPKWVETESTPTRRLNSTVMGSGQPTWVDLPTSSQISFRARAVATASRLGFLGSKKARDWEEVSRLFSWVVSGSAMKLNLDGNYKIAGFKVNIWAEHGTEFQARFYSDDIGFS